jgi:hypothetical protein
MKSSSVYGQTDGQCADNTDFSKIENTLKTNETVSYLPQRYLVYKKVIGRISNFKFRECP